MAAGEIRRALMGRIPDTLRNCVNKEYFNGGGGYGESINGAGGYNYTGPIVPHSTTVEPPNVSIPNSLNTSHPTPHSTLQDTNHISKAESSEVH